MNIKQTLRDKKKEATAYALAEAAFELALERGLDGFIVDDVVQRAGYSRRTFANHFSCKEEAVATAAVAIRNGEEEYEELIAGLPQDTPPLEILYHLMKMQITADFLRKLQQFVSLSKQYSTLEPYILSVFRRLQLSAQEALEQFSNDYPAGYTPLLIGAVYGAFVPILDGSMNVLLPDETENEDLTTEAITFDQYLNSIFAYLRNGF